MKNLGFGLLAMIAICFGWNGTASAERATRYDSLMNDCLSRKENPSDRDAIMDCHRRVMYTMIKPFRANEQFNECTDYYDSEVSFEKEVSCLRQLN